MSGNKLLEPELQAWFKEVTTDRTLADHIVGVEELSARAQQLKAMPRAMETVTREGVIKALRVCGVLSDSDHLSADRSVAAPGLPQLRPDIVLTSDSGHYILIELKVQPKPERQAVQELLAYSASIKMQAPYLNDFMFIIVARHWDTLLDHATRALIMDGKHVLPLQVVELADSVHGARKFALHIRHDLFEVNFVQFFDPWHALVPAEICVCRPRFAFSVDNYLRGVVRSAMDDAMRLNQTGCAFTWAIPDPGAPTELAGATLVTVNQHWREGEALDGWYPRYSNAIQRGFHGLHRGAKIRQQRPIQGPDADERALEQAFAHDAASRAYKQSALSYELLERYRNRDTEDELWRRIPEARDFDVCGSYFHLAMYLEHYAFRHMAIRKFVAFGELADFMREHYRRIPSNSGQLGELIDRFKEYKMMHPDALPDEWPEELMEAGRPSRHVLF